MLLKGVNIKEPFTLEKSLMNFAMMHFYLLNHRFSPHLLFHFIAAPSGRVQNVTVSNVTSTSVFISWLPPAVAKRHGQIKKYGIYWINACKSKPNTSSHDTEKCVMSLSHNTRHHDNITVYGNLTAVTLNHLVAFTRYEFIITAATSQGRGPSLNVTFDTPEDGESISKILDKRIFLDLDFLNTLGFILKPILLVLNFKGLNLSFHFLNRSRIARS